MQKTLKRASRHNKRECDNRVLYRQEPLSRNSREYSQFHRIYDLNKVPGATRNELNVPIKYFQSEYEGIIFTVRKSSSYMGKQLVQCGHRSFRFRWASMQLRRQTVICKRDLFEMNLSRVRTAYRRYVFRDMARHIALPCIPNTGSIHRLGHSQSQPLDGLHPRRLSHSKQGNPCFH